MDTDTENIRLKSYVVIKAIQLHTKKQVNKYHNFVVGIESNFVHVVVFSSNTPTRARLIQSVLTYG